MADIRKIKQADIIRAIKDNGTLDYYHDLGSQKAGEVLDNAVSANYEILKEEPKLSRALSQGISDQKEFKGRTRVKDIIKELSSDLDIDPPDYEFSYSKIPNAAGYADVSKNKIGLNPEFLHDYGREAVIAHELRHIKEGNIGFDKSIRNTLYTGEGGGSLLEQLQKSFNVDTAIKQERGRALNDFIPVKERLFENDKLKKKVDALKIYEFIEKGHFKDPFLVKNLKRIAKGLPIIGLAASVLTSEDASAAVDPMGSETIAVDRAIEDPSSPEFKERRRRMLIQQLLEKGNNDE